MSADVLHRLLQRIEAKRRCLDPDIAIPR